MKLRTHYVFTLGILNLIGVFFLNFYTSFLLSAIISFISNTIIDRLGHVKKYSRRIGTFYSRTPLTHTFPRSIFWGFVSSLPFNFLFYYTKIISQQDFIIASALSLVAGPSHMFLDIFTENGIYVKKNGSWRRFALAHFDYNNVFINSFFIIIGIIMIILSYYLKIMYIKI